MNLHEESKPTFVGRAPQETFDDRATTRFP